MTTRICCLTPSATDICRALGLPPDGVTHECDQEDAAVVTVSGLPSDASQRQIHNQVQETAKDTTLPSLYPIVDDAFREALACDNEHVRRVVITQDLCHVCAPSRETVRHLIDDQYPVEVLSLSPRSLSEVAESFVAVGRACGVDGESLQSRFQAQLTELRDTVHRTRSEVSMKARLLEWVDPPLDGGLWIPDMMECVGLVPTSSTDADVVFMSCCGFDLERNIQDAHMVPKELRSARIYGTNANLHFARPGPKLIDGACVMALCAYENQPQVVAAIRKLSFCPQQPEYQRITEEALESKPVTDIEDFAAIHQKACDAGALTYEDPATGYSVFTEIAHRNRSRCCGSGCRHCPYSHENLKDKVNRAQQPTFFCKYDEDSPTSLKNGNLKVLFFSGGKDSFLALRALVREARENGPFGIVLLTTFDATSRTIAHQEVGIDQVLRQAEHLKVSLVGVPMHRASSEGYVARIQKALDLIARTSSVHSLVFGDLFLEHIVEWRKRELGALGCKLEFPLLHVPYDQLMKDLARSGVPCCVSASSTDEVVVGESFDEKLYQRLKATSIDPFGEKGEFHSLAKVWEVDRLKALSLE